MNNFLISKKIIKKLIKVQYIILIIYKNFKIIKIFKIIKKIKNTFFKAFFVNITQPYFNVILIKIYHKLSFILL